MRLAALASVTVLAASASGLAFAQTDAAAPAPAAAPATPATAPSDPMAMQPGQAPATPVPAEAKPPFTPAPVTDPAAQAVMAALTKVCQPAVTGGNLDALAKANGFKLKRGQWVQTLAKPLTVTIDQAGANPDVCTVTVDFPAGPDTAIYTALNEWAFVQQPELVQYRNDEYAGSDFKRRTLSWEGTANNVTTGLVYIQLKKPDGTPAGKGTDRSQVLFTVRESSAG